MNVLEAGDPDAPPTEGRPLPRPDHVSAHFWAEAAAGRLVLQRCTVCGEAQFYPRALCAHCGGDTAWEEASGTGTIHTFTVIRQNGVPPFNERIPFVVATVDLDEDGARLIAAMPALDPADARVGMRVRAAFRAAGEELGFVDFVAK